MSTKLIVTDLNLETPNTSETLSVYVPNEEVYDGAWNVGAGYFVTEFDFETIEDGVPASAPTDFRFKPDGTRIYLSYFTNSYVIQYDLSTPWDITTASFAGLYNPEFTTNRGIEFSSDGTNFYICNDQHNYIERYELGEAWNIVSAPASSTANLAASKYGTSTGQVFDIKFRPDGRYFYVLDRNTLDVHEVFCHEFWKVETGFPTGRNLLNLSSPLGIEFNPDGTIFYYCSDTFDDVRYYSLSEAWNLQTATAVSSKDYNMPVAGTPHAVRVKPDGKKFWFLPDTSLPIQEYTIVDEPGAWDITNASFDNLSFNHGWQTSYGIWFKPDGKKMYILDSISSERIYQYDLSEAWNVNTATLATGTLPALQITGINNHRGMTFNNDGTRVYTHSVTNSLVYQYSLSEAWNVNTATLATGTANTRPDSGGNVYDIKFKPDGTVLYTLGLSTDRIYMYDLSEAWNVNTATFNISSPTFNAVDNNPIGFMISPKGDKVWWIGSDTDKIHEYAFSEKWNVATISKTTDYNVKAYTGETIPSGLYISPDSKKIYTNGTSTDTVWQFSLELPDPDWRSNFWPDGPVQYPDAWTLGSNTSYTNKSFTVTTDQVRRMKFKPDGTKAYVTDDALNVIKELTLSEAWNIQSATQETYTSPSFSLTGHTTIRGLEFNDTGDILYVSSVGKGNVGQYILTESWNIALMTVTANSLNVLAQVAGLSLADLQFNSDGTILYLNSVSNSRVYRFNLSEAWNVSTAVYNSNSTTAMANVDNSMDSIHIRSDGKKLIALGSAGSSMYEFDLKVPYDINVGSLVYTGNSFSVANEITTEAAIFISDQYAYASDFVDEEIHQYKLSDLNPYYTQYANGFTALANLHQYVDETAGLDSGDTIQSKYLTSGNSVNITFGLTDPEIPPIVHTDHKIKYRIRSNREEVDGPWDISLATYSGLSHNVQAQDTTPKAVVFRPEGNTIYVLGLTDDRVYQYSLSEAWNVNTASFSSLTFSVTSQEALPEAIRFNDDGTRMFMIGTNSDTFYQYDLSEAWNVNTASIATGTHFVGSGQQDTTPRAFDFNDDGTRMFMMGATGDTVYQYTLTEAWNVNTASYVTQAPTFTSIESSPYGFNFKPDGTSYYIIGTGAKSVIRYDLSETWNVATASYSSEYLIDPSISTNPYDVLFKPDGTRMYIIDAISNDRIWQYDLSDYIAPRANMTVSLMDGSTEIASWYHSNVPTSWTSYSQTLTEGQAANIVNYHALTIEVTANVG